jgi:hypothetical protein
MTEVESYGFYEKTENLQSNNIEINKMSIKTRIYHEIKEDIVFLFFNLTRKHITTTVLELKTHFMNVLELLKNNSYIETSDFRYFLTIILRLITHTRDDIYGKGEHELFYMLLLCLYQYYPIIAIFLVKRIFNNGIARWRDIKYLCEYISHNSIYKTNDSFIHQCLEIMNNQLRKDLAVFCYDHYSKYSISNVAKWIPRENKHFSWLFDKLVLNWFGFSMYVINENRDFPPVFDKYRRLYRKKINQINQILDTTEIKQCSRDYDKIIPENVSKYTLMKHRSLYFEPVSKDGSDSLSMYNKKMICNKNFEKYFEDNIFDIKTKKNIDNREPEIHRNFCRLFVDLPISYFIKQSVLLYENRNIDGFDKKVSILNKQWDIFYSNFYNRFFSINREQYIIPVLDISQSNHWFDSESFYSGLGIAILIALINDGDFNKRFMCIDNLPTWIVFVKTDIFSIVSTVFDFIKSRKSTYANFYNAIDLIKITVIETGINKSFVDKMKIIFLSDFDKIDGQFYNNLVQYFICNHSMDENNDVQLDMDNLINLDEYFIPHFTFWNLSKKQIIPIPSSYKQPKTILLSGFSPTILVDLFDFFKNIENIHNSPYDFIVRGIFNTHRYDFIDEYLSSIIS